MMPPTKQELESEGFNQVAHKVIDLLYFDSHSDEMRQRERDKKLSEIETIVNATIGKIASLEKQRKRKKTCVIK